MTCQSPIPGRQSFTVRRFDPGLIFKAILAIVASGLLLSANGNAENNPANLSGTYVTQKNQFSGSIIYRQTIQSNEALLFHLPPNWYSQPDRRSTYLLRGENGTLIETPRGDLSALETSVHQNRHFPKSIDIKSVRINQQPVAFQYQDNPYLAPRKNSLQTMLSVPIYPSYLNQVVEIEITFSSHFRPLPAGYKRILWDFVPRPIWRAGDLSDFRGDICPLTKLRGEIDVINGQKDSDKSQVTINQSINNPIIIIDPWDVENEFYAYSLDDSAIRNLPALFQMTHQALLYLLKAGWIIPSDSDYRFIIWDGGLTTSGNHIFLPRRLLRYDTLFHKTIETLIIKGILLAEIRKRYIVEPNKDPWVIPAIQAEVIRAYFDKEYKGVTRQFPWIDWMNLDYPLENTVNEWIINSRFRDVIDGENSADQSYYQELYHPGYTKGFHLLWMIHGGDPTKQNRVRTDIKTLLRRETTSTALFDSRAFFSLFDDTSGQGKAWLKKESRVDYQLESVSPLGNGDLQLEISNAGTMTPSLEIEFTLSDGKKVRKLLEDAVGTHTYSLPQKPVQVLLDPDRQLLEDNILNNSWTVPIKMRPFGDFLSADRWVFGVYPLMQGNTFDQNLLGLSFSLDYIEQTSISANIWAAPATGNLLWEGLLLHKGYPFKGSELSCEISQLGGTQSFALGYYQEINARNRLYAFGITGWTERLGETSSSSSTASTSIWNGAAITLGIPVLRTAFFDWNLTLGMKGAISTQSDAVNYQTRTLNHLFRYKVEPIILHLNTIYGDSVGSVPIQKKFPMGGATALPGYPRNVQLLFDEVGILEVGIEYQAILASLDANMFRVIWLKNVVPSLYFHWGKGRSGVFYNQRAFSDVELRFELWGEFFNRYVESFQLTLAKPIGDREYQDVRLVLQSSWVF